MLTVAEAIRQQRSIRRFRLDLVPQEYILRMPEAACLDPSGGNRQLPALTFSFLKSHHGLEKER